MLRILKYLKPFRLAILLAILLLFIQANADLALPDYMSRIVNVGIQQGGIENAVPQVMRATTFQHVELFLNADERALLHESYTKIEPGSPEYEAIKSDYTKLEKSAYLLNTQDAQRLDQINTMLAKALLAVYGIEQIQENPSMAQTFFPESHLDIARLPAGMDVFTLLSMLPESQRQQIRSAVEARFATIGGERALLQAAAKAVQDEYIRLGRDMARVQNEYILRVGAQMLFIALISAITTVSVGLIGARVAAGLGRDLRRLLFDKVMRFSSAEFNRFSTASLITRSTNDITQIQMVTMIMVRMVFYAPIIGIGGILRALSKSASMWWIIALAVAVLLTLIITVFNIAVPKFKLIQDLIDRLNRIARENLSGMMVVRAFNRQEHEEKRFDIANLDLTHISLFINRVFVIVMPMMMLIMNGVSMLIIWVGAQQVAQATMQVGDMMAFMQYAMQIVFAFMMLSMLFILFPRADVSANRVAEVLETEIQIQDAPDAIHFPHPFVPSIEFRHVSFRYPDAEENVLCDLNFCIEAGQTVGIIGTTGSGKSTIVNLIPRFYEVTEGAILISGVDIRRVALSELRDKIGFIPQQSNLFSGTIESNLRFANEDASPEIFYQVLSIAQAEDFVFQDNGGLSAPVAQGGANFSGGQKQRLAIARALAKKTPIYIFDDSFSSLDYKTDVRLRTALRQFLHDSTVIIVSQRVATLKDAHLILVLDQGEVIGRGTHEELMRTCPVYREIAESQLKQEVLL